MSKLTSDAPFGETLSLKMEVGTLVSWIEWIIADNSLLEEVHYGTVVKRIAKVEGNRSVIIVMVACAKTGCVLSLNPFQLRIEETN